jgi:hypothetical protein
MIMSDPVEQAEVAAWAAAAKVDKLELQLMEARQVAVDASQAVDAARAAAVNNTTTVEPGVAEASGSAPSPGGNG